MKGLTDYKITLEITRYTPITWEEFEKVRRLE